MVVVCGSSMYRHAKQNVILMAGLFDFTIKYYVLESSLILGMMLVILVIHCYTYIYDCISCTVKDRLSETKVVNKYKLFMNVLYIFVMKL